MGTTGKPLLELTSEDVMSRDIVAIPQVAPLRDAAALLRRARVTGAPVVDEQGRCVGVLSAVDFLRCLEADGPGPATRPVRACPYQTEGRLLSGEEALICTLAWGSCPWQEPRLMPGGRYADVCLRLTGAACGRRQAELPSDAVTRYMTADVVTAGPQAPLPELARRMVDAHIHRLIVVDEQGRPVGIVSSADVLAALARERTR
jgi:CBS-domain-containing membrane protein